MDLNNKDFRLTPQRKAILEELKKDYSHPTADVIYERVRKKLPKISLATVYRNLELMAEEGIIQKLTIESQMHFDGQIESHFHIYCTKCGKIADIWQDIPVKDLLGNLKTDFSIHGYSLVFYGICPECQKKTRF